MTPSNKERALACAARGWLVFPSEGKQPKVRWSMSSTLDPYKIDQWWSQWPDADVCIKTGAESNLVVVDWDAYKIASPLKQMPLGDRLPVTYSVETNNGGYHYYFTHPGFPVSNSAGQLAEYVDVRGDGGMVVAYPTVVCPTALAPMPPELCVKRTHVVDYNASLTPPVSAAGHTAHPLVQRAYRAALANITHADEGKRNYILYANASDVYGLVWQGELDKDEVTNEMAQTAYEAGLDPMEIRATLVSAMRNAASKHDKENT